ncbi:MAG: serine/threonine-protein kinase, partial [Myxococcota bacterium]
MTSSGLYVVGVASPHDLPTYIGIVCVTSLLFGASRWNALSDARVMDLGLLAQVALCGLISIPPAFTSLQSEGRFHEPVWTCVIIVLFPLLAPSPPRRMLAASVASALTVPLGAVMAALEIRGDYNPIVPVLVSLNPMLCVIFAYLGARMLYRLSAEAERGRRMGSYELLERLGMGGMGEVWRARHGLLSRPAAVKLIRPVAADGSVHETSLARFEREAQATAALRSPHTVEVYDFGRSDDGAFYYVMELLVGADLQQLVEAHGALPPGRVVFMLRQVCHSLAEAHRRGLVHRDIKPANLLACRYGDDDDFIKVLDFGLVRESRSARNDGLTQENAIVGTPAYLSPEAISGATLDARADLYALGCVAYWMLSGRPVFEAEGLVQVAAKHLETVPEPPSAKLGEPLPESLEAAVMKCLEKDPAK